MPHTNIPPLVELLTYKRPAGSRAERLFIRRFVAPTGARPDAKGNYMLRIGSAPIAWCSHTDTVHSRGGRQQVIVTPKGLAWTPDGDCLGADDGTGVWLMLGMIAAGVEGLYIFHRAEEIGCIGSRYIAESTPEVLDGIRAAIAFDRRGYDSIVTHQCGVRGCTDSFAEALAGGLGADMYPDPTGIYTDTERYIGIVPECTNVSVGYYRQHSQNETQDIDHAHWLLSKLVNLDLSAIVDASRTVATRPDTWYDEWGDLDDVEDDGSVEVCEYCWAETFDLYAYSGGFVCEQCHEELSNVF